jgi:aarF domain-containing kinase
VLLTDVMWLLLCVLLSLQAMAAAFGRPADEVFSYISPRPVAAASLGQVYRAQLRPQFGGGEVAVKVQRPDVLEQVRYTLTHSLMTC